MSSYNILFPSYTIGTDAYTKIPEICPTYGRKIAVIGGKTALSKARPAMEAALKDCPELQILDFIWYGGDSTLEHVEDMKKNPAVQEADMLFGVGGGRAIDTCKMTAHDLKKPFFTFPTIASTCAACTGVAVEYHPNGVFRGLYLSDIPATHIFINTKIIAEAPDTYLWAGIGDTLAKHYESELSSRGDELEHYNALGVNIGIMSAEPLIQYGAKGLAECRANQAGHNLEQTILAIIISTGLVSNLVINDYNSCLAHSIYYGVTTLGETAEKHLHGEIVSYGVLVLLTLDHQTKERDRIFRFNKSIGLPTCLADLDITTEAQLKSVIDCAAATPDITHVPYAITAEMIHEAIMDLEEYNKQANKKSA